jgi:hypothetical protein
MFLLALFYFFFFYGPPPMQESAEKLGRMDWAPHHRFTVFYYIHRYNSSKMVSLLCTRGARFFLVKLTKTGKIYHKTTKYSKSLQNVLNTYKIYQMAIKQTKNFHCKAFQCICIKIGIFGMKIYHLAFLLCTR